MPRTSRTLVDGGYYHVLTRGNDRKILFYDTRDYACFIGIIKKYLAKYQVGIVHYCLMPNHIHFLIYAQKARDLSKFMQAVLQVYASYFRKKYNAVGFVFQNRFKSHYIDNDAYLLECGRYIERNPLRAQITDDLLNYPWSSFSFYLRQVNDELVKTINPLYLGLADTEEGRKKRYHKYVARERFYEHIIDKFFKIKY